MSQFFPDLLFVVASVALAASPWVVSRWLRR